MTVWHLISLANIVCAAIGGFVGSRTGRLPAGLLAGLIGGPFGLVFFLLRPRNRRPTLTARSSVPSMPSLMVSTPDPVLAGPLPATADVSLVGTRVAETSLSIPVQVLIGGIWTDGTLGNWRQGATQWEGSVTYRVGAGSITGWFPTELVRRSEGAQPTGS